MTREYVVKKLLEANKENWPYFDDEFNNGEWPEADDWFWYDAEYECGLWEVRDGRPYKLLAIDGGEPEDHTLDRKWSWVAKALKEAYDDGYDQGVSAGYDDGYHEGVNVGYDQGYEDASVDRV